jgi:hypothetical protein
MSVPIQLLWDHYTGKTIRYAVRDERCGKQVDTYVAESPFRDLGADELEFYEIAKRGREERFRYCESMVLDVDYSSKGICLTLQDGRAIWVSLGSSVRIVETLTILTT